MKRLAALLPARRRTEIESEVDAEIEKAIAFAEESPFPDLAELMTDVFHTRSTGAGSMLPVPSLPGTGSTALASASTPAAARRGKKPLTIQKAA